MCETSIDPYIYIYICGIIEDWLLIGMPATIRKGFD